jgi:hypothetical protein
MARDRAQVLNSACANARRAPRTLALMKVFLSYNRADAAAAASIATDLEGLGHDIWYDTEISGGQSWWDTILAQIRESDLFILLMTTKSLNSEACPWCTKSYAMARL